MVTLKKAHQELFRRTPDQCFESMDSVRAHCLAMRERSEDLWKVPDELSITHDLTICADGEGSELELNDWSFSQLCRMAGVSKETINRLSRRTASRAFEETLPRNGKPLQLMRSGDMLRSVHGVVYTRLWNSDLIQVVDEFASEFSPPQEAAHENGTGLYCGEQDIFLFLIDPMGWVEIEKEAFAPGFFVWNSEVGKRSLGIQTFWFQAICQNHIVWDATEFIDFSRKHTTNVGDGLDEIRRILESLRQRRDERRDSFANVIRRAMSERLGADRDDIHQELRQRKIPAQMIDDAMDIARQHGAFTIFALVDALTKLTQEIQFAGTRTQLDARIGQLLSLAI